MVVSSKFDPWSAALGVQSHSKARPESSAKAAAQSFEALLIRQFLSTARSTSWTSDAAESESGWREIADDALAGYLVRAGGLGLTKQVETLISQAGLRRPSRTSFSQLESNASALNNSSETTVNGDAK